MLINNDKNENVVPDPDPHFMRPEKKTVKSEQVDSRLLDSVSKAPVLSEVSGESAPISETEMLRQLVKQLMESTKIAQARETRLAKLEEEEETRKRIRREQYERNRVGTDTAIIELQTRCLHLKGGRHRKPSDEDYAVYAHRFIDNVLVIKCMLCKMKWYPTDTPECIVRGGTVRTNHTGKGWREALLMVQKSTNKFSSSEMPPETAGRIQKAEDIPDTPGVIAR